VRYWLEQMGRKKLYTEKLLLHLASSNGHTIEMARDSVILASLCDVTEMMSLERIRAKYPGSVIIAGGHLAKIGAKAMGLFADAVWVGHAFEFFRCQSLDEIYRHPSCYVPGKDKQVAASTSIDWRQCPAIQTDKRRFYVFGGAGCRGKCSFCLTSWTEPHQERPGAATLVGKLRPKIGKGNSIKIISNAYTSELGDDLVQDMMLKDVLKVRSNDKRKLIRCGVEFATEASRRKHAKPIKDEEIRQAVAYAERLNLDLQFFLIGGRDTREDWERFVEVIPPSDAMRPRVFFKWTNLEYQQKTPLWSEVSDIDFGRYLDRSFTDWFFRNAAHKNKRVRVLPVKYPAHAVWRICMSNVQDMEQYLTCKRERNTKDMDRIKRLFADVQPWSNDLSMITAPPFDKVTPGDAR